MKKLSDKQLDFLYKEFGVSEIDYQNTDMLEDLRLKCFDIETDECYEHLKKGIDDVSIGERGDMAVSIIDDLEDIICA